jgi:hypothetical protein
MTDVKRLQKNVVLAIYILCFAEATLNHSLDFLQGGWLPYRSGPIPLRFFWTLLVILDPVVIGLLLFNRLRSGLLLALVVMLGDVFAFYQEGAQLMKKLYAAWGWQQSTLVLA